MAIDEQRLPVALLVATFAWCLGLALLGADDAVLFLAPALLLAVPLALRRYPGEDSLLGFGTRGQGRLRPEPRAPAPIEPRRQQMPRGALLLARSLAERAPPLRLAGS